MMGAKATTKPAGATILAGNVSVAETARGVADNMFEASAPL
jgi:hypothetical protein